MKVRILVSLAGLPMPHYGIDSIWRLSAGDVLDLHDELAGKWIGSGFAERTRAKAGPAGTREND